MPYTTQALSKAVVAIAILLSAVSVADKKGNYQSGSSSEGGEKFRLLAFTVRGSIGDEDLGKAIYKEVEEIVKADETAEFNWLGRDGAVPPVDDNKEAFGLRRGDVFVTGVYYEAHKKWNLILVENVTGGAYPKFKYVDEAGRSGVLDSSKADRKAFTLPGKWKGEKATVTIGLATSAGWIAWYLDPGRANTRVPLK